MALTHYNMVANMCQIMHPDVLMIGQSDQDNQESTVAVLPFFHIYAMNTIMTLALHLGAKIVTLPKFEPDAYMLALQVSAVQYILFNIAKTIHSIFVNILACRNTSPPG